MISIGDKLPDFTFFVMTEDGPAKLESADLFGGKKVALFALPGAFTPTCNSSHLPGFIAHSDALKAKGIDTIACLSVNDVFVMGAWAKSVNAGDTIQFLADGSALFTKAIGMEVDRIAVGMGIRSQRYSMIVDDGVVTAINLEEKTGVAEKSGAEALLAQL